MRTLGRVKLSFAAVGSIALLGAVAPGASAQFTSPFDETCEGTGFSINGEGATFARDAHLGFGARIIGNNAANPIADGFGYDVAGCEEFKLPADGGSRDIQYAPTGSGAGRTAMGANGDADTRLLHDEEFGGTDDAPTGTPLTSVNGGQIWEANLGPDDTQSTSDDTRLHTVPVAQGAIEIAVTLPTGCQVLENTNLRRISRVVLEGAFAGAGNGTGSGAYDEWGEIFGTNITADAVGGGPSDADCQGTEFKRVVRRDSSGTTAQLKSYLHQINGSLTPTTWAALGNTVWPNETNNPVVRATLDGAGPLAQALTAQASSGGGIGYFDVATGSSQVAPNALLPASANYRWGGNSDLHFYLGVQRINNDFYALPVVNGGELESNPTKGANCGNTQYTGVPADASGRNGTEFTWVGVTPNQTAIAYPLCALTYVLVNEDPCADWGPGGENIANAEALARTTADYVSYMTGVGQTTLAGRDYAALPTSGSPSISGQATDAATEVEDGWSTSISPCA